MEFDSRLMQWLSDLARLIILAIVRFDRHSRSRSMSDCSWSKKLTMTILGKKMYGNMEDLPVEAQEKIRKAIRAGRKLDAVKVYYNQTKHSLLQSKKIIEDEMDRLKKIDPEGLEQLGESAGPDEMDQILDCIFANKKLDAVKIYKESTGLSLMESKKFIEELIDPVSSSR